MGVVVVVGIVPLVWAEVEAPSPPGGLLPATPVVVVGSVPLVWAEAVAPHLSPSSAMARPRRDIFITGAATSVPFLLRGPAPAS